MEDDAVNHRMSAEFYDQQQFRVDFQGNLKIEKIVEFADKKVFRQAVFSGALTEDFIFRIFIIQISSNSAL